MVSYADLMTLLFGFFVLMYTFAAAKQKDNDAMIEIRKEVAKHFGGDFVSPYDTVVKDLKERLKSTKILDNMDIKLRPEGLSVTFRSSALFTSGSAELFPPAKDAIRILIGLVKEKKPQLDKVNIQVEGHTDDVPIETFRFPSNWELSGARAAAVLRLFESEGFSKENLVGIGYADARPNAPHKDANGKAILENRAKNRRVVISIAIDEYLELPKKGG